MNSRIIEFDDGKKLEIIQDLNFGYAGEVWDAALVLSHFMINKNKKHTITFENKIILELGSGTGIIGLVASCLGASKVYLTDKEENLKILEQNYEKNKNLITNCELGIKAIDWNKKHTWENIKEDVDMIICSDLVWNPDYFIPLIDTLDKFCIPEHTEILLCYQYRKKTDLDFFNLIKATKQWTIERISDSWLDEEYKCDDIFIIFIKKNKITDY